MTTNRSPDDFVQLRNEEGSLVFVSSIEKAMKEAEKDSDIWKISWTDGTTNERVRLIRRTVKYQDESEVTFWSYEPLDFNEIKEELAALKSRGKGT